MAVTDMIPNMIRGTLRGAIAMATITGTARAQDLTVTAPEQTEAIAILGGTVHPIAGEPIEDGMVIFENGVITYVGPIRTNLPMGTRQIDAMGKHVMPGMISGTTALGLSEIQALKQTEDYDETGAITPEALPAVAFNPDSTLMPVTRSAGILVAGVMPRGGRVPGRASVMQLEGWTNHDLALLPDAGVVVNWPNMRPVTAWWMEMSAGEQKKRRNEQLAQIDGLWAQAEAYVAERDADSARAVDVRLEALRPTLEGNSDQRPVFVRAQDIDQITSAVRWGAERGLDIVIVGGRDAPMVSDLLKAHDVDVMLTGINTFPKRADAPYDAVYTVPAKLEAAGIRWCLSNGDDPGHERSMPHHAGKAIAFGLDRAAAWRGLTLSAAEILGVDERVGSLEVGKDATLSVIDGEPWEVTSRVEAAFIGGREIDLSNKQSKLADKYREKYRQLGVTRED